MIKRIVEPTKDPVTYEEVFRHLKLDDPDDEDKILVESMLSTAVSMVEEYTRTSIISQTWDMVIDHACHSYIDLPRPPLRSVSGVYVTDDLGVESIVDPASYRVDMVSTPGRLFLKPGYSWPIHTMRAGFRIRYTAGYDDDTKVPRALKNAIKSLVTYLYVNRGDTRGTVTFAGQQGQLPDDIKVALDQFKVYI